MKKICVMSLLILLFALIGCGKEHDGKVLGKFQSDSENKSNTQVDFVNSTLENEEESVREDVEFVIEENDDELSLMQRVLLNKEMFYARLAFYDEESVGWHKIDEYSGLYEYGDDTFNNFYIVDMDHDGEDEVCVCYKNDVLIFHYIDGKIHGYNWGTRQFRPLYMDGTFEGTVASNVSYYYGNVSFLEDTFDYVVISSVEITYEEKSDIKEVHFYRTEEKSDELIEISKEEYDEIMSQYPQVEATAYDFTIENILKYIP